MVKKSHVIQIIPPKKKGDKKAKIVLSEELTIYNIEEFKDAIFNAVKKYNQIEMLGENVKEIDLAFIQLIKAVQKTALNEGKTFTVNIKLSDENQELFNNTDITKIIQNTI